VPWLYFNADLAVSHARFTDFDPAGNRIPGAPNVIALTQEDLASFVGATRVAVNRVLVDLERQGAVKLGRGQVDLVDLVLLKKAIRY